MVCSRGCRAEVDVEIVSLGCMPRCSNDSWFMQNASAVAACIEAWTAALQHIPLCPHWYCDYHESVIMNLYLL